MEVFHIKGTEEIPEITLDKDAAEFSFVGRSIPEDVSKLFDPVFSWFKGYIADPHPYTELRFALEYFNTSSARRIVELLITVSELIIKGKEFVVVWEYSADDDLIESKGRELHKVTGIPFKFVAK